MEKYKRVTDKKIDLDKLSEKAKSKINDTYLKYAKMNNALWELEEKIENGTLVETKYPLYSTVYIIDYIDEKGHSIYGTNSTIRECFVCEISQVLRGMFLYRVQPHKLPQDVMDEEIKHIEYWEKNWAERELFLTKAEAEKKLKELKDER